MQGAEGQGDGRTGDVQGAQPHPLVGRRGEVATLEALLATVGEGGSAALTIVGEAGVGKSALLDQLVTSANGFQVLRAVGVEGEIDLPYAGLQQLCRPITPALASLPPPQREALELAFGFVSGDAANRYLIGLAALTLLSEVASTRPLLCVVDDAQWMDTATLHALAFVARRLGADSVGLVFASREVVVDLDGVPVLEVDGLGATDSRMLLDSVLMGHVDGTVRQRLLAEARGNPLALIELPRSLTPAEAAAGILPVAGGSVPERVLQGFRRRLDAMPDDTRRLLLLAAAEPLGDQALLLRAASHLGCSIDAADAAEKAGLVDTRERLSFRHPLVRTAVYRSATQRDRRSAHAALADETDPLLDPDRRAWHRAQAAPAPDEEIAAELEATAARAKSRGGLAAAGAFLERAAALTPEESRRAARTLTAADVMFEAGALDAADALLDAVDRSLLDEIQRLRAAQLRAHIDLARRENEREATLALLEIAKQLRLLDPSLGRTAYLQALHAASNLSNPDIVKRVAGDLEVSPPSDSGAIIEMVLRGWAQLLEHGFPVGTDLLRDAMFTLRDRVQLDESDLPLMYFILEICRSLWDIESGDVVARRGVQLARDSGAHIFLARMLEFSSELKTATGDFASATAIHAEADAICQVIGASPDVSGSALDAWCFELPTALARIDADERRTIIKPYLYASRRAVAYLAAGQYEAALQSAKLSCDLHPLGVYGPFLANLIEAAVRCGDDERARSALGALVARARLASTDWALGLEARSTALLSNDVGDTERLYQEALVLLDRAGTRPDLGRAQLLYGEWLRRQGRRVDAREQLRAAHALFSDIGAPGFADRARRELLASGETARKRTDDTRPDLTPQEAQIARLALDGWTNAEIGSQLFLSPRTVEWHLRHVYGKLGVTSRRELRTAAVRVS